MNNQKRLSDVTREASTSKVNKFANSLLPSTPKPRVEQVAPEAEVAESDSATSATTPSHAPEENVSRKSPEVAPKAERARKASALSVEDIVSGSAKEGDTFNKMVRVTDEHHELLRVLAFKYRKPMNVIVHNLLDHLRQLYQKEQKGGESDV